jgi:hypothetical protein
MRGEHFTGHLLSFAFSFKSHSEQASQAEVSLEQNWSELQFSCCDEEERSEKQREG